MTRPLPFLLLALSLLALACKLFAPATPAPLPTRTAILPTTQPPPPVTLPSTEFLTPQPTAQTSPQATTNPLGEREVCPGQGQALALLVEPSLSAAIRPGLEGFEADLCGEGYHVFENDLPFAGPPELRGYLIDLYARTGGSLTGVYLIGNQPHAYQWVTAVSTNPSFPSTSEEVISLQYYADLDGVFETSPGYASPNGRPFSFDVHRDQVDWEIWVSVLPTYGDPGKTSEALLRYFAKNHTYRAGGYDVPRGFLEVSEHFNAATPEQHNTLMNGLISGDYAWTPLSNSPEAHIYFESPTQGLTVDQGYALLSGAGADLAVLDAHGFWGASGRLDIPWVESHPLRTVFLWSNGCAVGDLDQPLTFLSTALYAPQSLALVAKGTTNNSGGMGTNAEGFFGHNVASTLASGGTFGEAILRHVNTPLIYPWSDSREFHYATVVILGDPTLRRR